MTEVVVTTGNIRRAKFQSNRHHQQTQHPTFYRPDALPVAQPTESALKECTKKNTMNKLKADSGLCTTHSSNSPVATTTSIILCFNKHRLTQVHLENGR